MREYKTASIIGRLDMLAAVRKQVWAIDRSNVSMALNREAHSHKGNERDGTVS